MKLIRNEIFETNSSSTHSLVTKKIVSKLPKRIKSKNFKGEYIESVTADISNFRIVCGRFVSKSKWDKFSKMEFPTFNGEKLTDPEINASYLFTWLQIKVYNNIDCRGYGDRSEMEKAVELLAKFHELLLDLELNPKYQMPTIKYDPYDYNYDGEYKDIPKVSVHWELQDVYMEYNDGGFIEGFDDVEKYLASKEALRVYLTHYKIKMVYAG